MHLLLILATVFHPYFVSVTEIKHSQKAGTLQISTKIFYEDLEKALTNQGVAKIDILKSQKSPVANKLIAEYLKKHLIIKINGQAIPVEYLGYEIEEDSAWSYMEAKTSGDVKTVQVVNDILFAQHESQINIVHITVNEHRRSFQLANPTSIAKASF